jgi:hypothetical protein
VGAVSPETDGGPCLREASKPCACSTRSPGDRGWGRVGAGGRGRAIDISRCWGARPSAQVWLIGLEPAYGAGWSSHLIETTARSFLPRPRHLSRPSRSRTLAARLNPTLSSAAGVSSATFSYVASQL